MNQIAPLLSTARISLDLDVSSKTRLFEEVGQLLAGNLELDAKCIVESLSKREMLGSTGLGQGMALPHARIKGLTQPVAVFVRLSPPIPFDAPDGKPVSDSLVLLVPEQATEVHLQLVAEAAQMFADRRFRERLRKQKEVAGAYLAFVDWPVIAE
jgi:PTS system nitrogen regulatory IIA component